MQSVRSPGQENLNREKFGPCATRYCSGLVACPNHALTNPVQQNASRRVVPLTSLTDYHIPVPWNPSGLARVREMVPVSSHLLLQDKETLTLHKQYLAIFESGSKRFNSDFVLGDETPDLDHIDLTLREHNPTSTSYSPETTHSPLLAPILTIPPLETDLCINPESLHQSTVVDNETVIPASSGRLRPDGSKKKSPKVPSKKPPKVPSKKPPKVLSKKPLEKTAETNTQSQQVEQCQVPGCGEMVLVTAANVEAHAGRKHCPKDVKESICEWPGCTKKLQKWTAMTDTYGEVKAIGERAKHWPSPNRDAARGENARGMYLSLMTMRMTTTHQTKRVDIEL
ncbi:hypothetical protein QCA50_007207 [Cerrena zonata]|uniref:C2H2-type domain-containing protein n=1 Tax=Cerrena zonata TaxID=2478898 RepID=A0AAW0G7H8_9APHY